MTIPVERVSRPGRVAEPGEGIGIDELRLAGRNHAMPLEMLRAELTPPGLHYVLTHYDVPDVDAATWRLDLGGEVEHPISLSMADLTAMPSRTVRVTLECAGNGRAGLSPRPVSQPWLTGAVGTAEWTGVPLRDLLADAAPTGSAVDVVFTGHDHGFERGVEQDYARGLSLAEADADDVLIAFAMNGAPLPAQHGFPARLVVPGWYGMAHVKWLRSITVIDHPFDGYQNAAYRLRQQPDDEGVPVTRIEPRALLMPPGDPDFMSRDRVLRPGPVRLRGRAWSGWGGVTRVEVSTDGGATWRDAALGPDEHRWAWREFTLDWEAGPGEHLLRARAHDATGRVQPVEPAWNRGGFTNTADDPVRVVVLDG
ncbi:sulfite oxidase [Nocardioides mesophilus]|uniref:Sulfite oxidase n=1 Tax=Nocardioides mesophilus TaxID=433659 RepID=A0A7G9R8Z4_9ACTN|nr:sulfite oxidase [Nocardioides mesophilus]QNN52069.1 sulfite oxidase [Nocardioides mesophilus]